MLISVKPAGTSQEQVPTVVNLRTVFIPFVLVTGAHVGAALAGSMAKSVEKAKRAPIARIEALFIILRFLLIEELQPHPSELLHLNPYQTV
jgi:hypothetical protein